jgi:hypothetical protein
MNWTKKIRTETGFYWWRRSIGRQSEIMFVTKTATLVNIKNGGASHLDLSLLVLGEWYGPLQTPGGDAIEN